MKLNIEETFTTSNTDQKKEVLVVGDRQSPFATVHSRDYYRGKSFHYAGEWIEGAHYVSDDYNIDFVSKDNTLLVCAKSHLSTSDNEPKNFIYNSKGYIVGLISTEWDFILAGKIGDNGKIYQPVYNRNTGVLTWNLITEDEAQDQIDINLSLTDIINAAITNANNAANAVTELIGEVDNLILNVNDVVGEAQRQTQNAINAAGYASEQGQRIQNFINSALQQSTGQSEQSIMSQKAITDELNKKADKIINAVSGNIIKSDVNGNLVDSGIVADNVLLVTDVTIASQTDINNIISILE